MTRPRAMRLAAGRSVLRGDLCVPRGARGLVVFVHGSGTTRRDASNRFVARRLEHAGFATLLLELLQEFETADRHNVFDVQMQAERLVEVRAHAVRAGLYHELRAVADHSERWFSRYLAASRADERDAA